MPTRPPVHRPAHLGTVIEQRRAFERDRGSSSARGYDRTWQRLRLQVLSEEPLCLFCQTKDRVVAATEVDHIKTIRECPEMRLVRSNLRSLCKPCHCAWTGRGRVG